MSESHNIEYKESWRDEYLRQICGLANTKGGSLFVGVNDRGEVIGVANAKKLEEDIPNKINDVLGFVADVRCLEKDGKSYVEIIIPPMATAISYKNKFYYRSGTVTLELTGSSLHTFLLERIGGRWDSQPVEGVTIEKLDRESFDIFRREAIRSRRMSIQDVEIPHSTYSLRQYDSC